MAPEVEAVDPGDDVVLVVVVIVVVVAAGADCVESSDKAADWDDAPLVGAGLPSTMLG